MIYKEKLYQLADNLEKDSILILFAAEKKIRNRDVFYDYRNASDLMYLTGYNEPGMVLCITSEKKFLFYMKFPDEKVERWTGKMLSPATVSTDFGIDGNDVREEKNFWQDISNLLKNKKIIYFDFSGNPENVSRLVSTINDLNKNNRDVVSGPGKIFHVSEILHEMRVIKSTHDVNKISRAIDITGIGFSDVMQFTREFLKKESNPALFEYNVKARIESSFKDNGAMNLAYPTIVASGNNANYLHYENCNKLIGPNDLILIDAGCEWMGYASDITRTFPANGKFNSAQREIYSIVLGAQKAAFEKCISGNTFENIHESAVRYIVEGLWELGLFKKIFDTNEKDQKFIKPESISEVIEKKYYRLYFMHYTSHYLGLDVHDVGKYFIDGKSRSLQAGMVFTVEPGIYINEDYDFIPEVYRGIGVRIEDNILMTENDYKILSENIPREINEIESIG